MSAKRSKRAAVATRAHPTPSVTGATRRMMTERVEYLVREALIAETGAAAPDAQRAAFARVLRAIDVDLVAELACERLSRAARTMAPSHAAAILRDETLVWRYPLGASLTPTPPPAVERDEFRAPHVIDHATPRERAAYEAAWLIDSAQHLPTSFAADPRAVFDSPHTTDERRAGDASRGLRHVERWSSAWPPGVEVSRVCEMLRATGAPDAAAVADDIRSSLFMGPETAEQAGARWLVGPTETPEQRRRRMLAVLRRWGGAMDAAGLALMLRREADLSEVMGCPALAPHVKRLRGGKGAPGICAGVIAANAEAAPETIVFHAANAVMRHLHSLWSPVAVAHIADAVERVDALQRGARMFAIPARQASRVPFEIMARAETFAACDVVRMKQPPRGSLSAAAGRVTWRVSWDGRPQDYKEQLAFGWSTAAPTADVFRDILRELGAEGLRDYVILHRMAAEQGRTGRFRWTWEAHRRATAHEARVRSSSTRDSDAKRATLNRIARLRAAELIVEAVNDRGERAWKVVGEAPLVSIVGGVNRVDGDIEGLELVLNATLYDGASADGRRYFTQIPEAVLTLPALAFSLAVMFAFRWRQAADNGGVVIIPKAKLHEYMDAGRWRRGNAADAAKTLDGALRRIAKACGPGCEFIDEGESITARPSAAFVAAVVDRVPPSLAASTAGIPRTGAELRAWRDELGLSQADAARLLDVGIATVKRAEAAPDASLPRAFRRAKWEAAKASRR